MAVTLYEAAKRSRDPIARDIFLGIATSDETIAKLRMERVSGKAFSWPREGSISEPAFVSPTHTSIAEGTGTDDMVSVPLRILLGDADVYTFVEEQMSDLGSQTANELRRKLKAAGRVIARKAITGGFATGSTITPAIAGVTFSRVAPGVDSDRFGPGDIKFQTGAARLSFRAPGDIQFGAEVLVPSNGTYRLNSHNPSKWLEVTVVAASLPGAGTESNITITSSTNEPDGLLTWLPTTSPQTRLATAADGDALSFAILDQLIDELVKTRGDLAFVGNAKLKAKFLALLRTAGGLTAGELRIPGINAPVPSYRGIPFLQNDNVPSTESKGSGTTLSSLFLVDFETDGFMAGVGGAGEDRLIDMSPVQTRVMGVRVRSVGELEDKEAVRTRVSWYGAFGLKSELAAARAAQLITA